MSPGVCLAGGWLPALPSDDLRGCVGAFVWLSVID